LVLIKYVKEKLDCYLNNNFDHYFSDRRFIDGCKNAPIKTDCSNRSSEKTQSRGRKTKRQQ